LLYIKRKNTATYQVYAVSVLVSELLYNWRPISHSFLALSPSGAVDQILVVVDTTAVLFIMGRSPW